MKIKPNLGGSGFQMGENARMALTTLRDHKLRSALTIIGVVIGITSIIAVASILVGLDADMRGFLNDFGADTLFIFKFEPGIHIGRLSTEERMRNRSLSKTPWRSRNNALPSKMWWPRLIRASI